MKILRNIFWGAAAARTRVCTQRKIEILWYAHDIKVPSSFFCFFFFFYLSGWVQSQGETKIVPNAHAMRLWAEGEAANLMMKSFPDLLTGNQQQNILVGVPHHHQHILSY